MVVYFDTQKLDGSCCFAGSVKEYLGQKGYTIYTSRGKYLKVDTVQKACFGVMEKENGCKVFNSRSSWVEIRAVL